MASLWGKDSRTCVREARINRDTELSENSSGTLRLPILLICVKLLLLYFRTGSPNSCAPAAIWKLVSFAASSVSKQCVYKALSLCLPSDMIPRALSRKGHFHAEVCTS